MIFAAGCAPAEKYSDCSASQATFDADVQYLIKGSPTRLRLMDSRYVDLRRAMRGLQCSGVPLVAFDGMRYGPTVAADDQGIFLIIPKVAEVLKVNVGVAADITFITAVVLSGVIGVFGFMMVATTSLGRRVGIAAFILLSGVNLRQSDVYMLAAVPAVASVPWLIFFLSRKKPSAAMFLTMLLVGFAAETSSYIRAHAGVGLVLFALVIVAFAYQVRISARIGLIVALFAGMIGPALFFQYLYTQRDAFLRTTPEAIIKPTQGHVFWHPVYLGLGWIKNSEVPAYDDAVADRKVQELHPGVVSYSPEYEAILKDQVVQLAKRKPWLIIENVLLKLVVVALFCVGGANVGLYAAKLERKPLAFEAAFWLVMSFYALPGILVVPHPSYILGMILFAAMYGAYSVEYAARNPDKNARLRWLRILLLLEPRKKAEATAVSC